MGGTYVVCHPSIKSASGQLAARQQQQWARRFPDARAMIRLGLRPVSAEVAHERRIGLTRSAAGVASY
jgi:hypothetical protein